jgi:hypothetical protein
MKLTFKLVTAKNENDFEALVNHWLSQGYRFINDQSMLIDRKGRYSLGMILEEGNQNVENA